MPWKGMKTGTLNSEIAGSDVPAAAALSFSRRLPPMAAPRMTLSEFATAPAVAAMTGDQRARVAAIGKALFASTTADEAVAPDPHAATRVIVQLAKARTAWDMGNRLKDLKTLVYCGADVDMEHVKQVVTVHKNYLPEEWDGVVNGHYESLKVAAAKAAADRRAKESMAARKRSLLPTPDFGPPSPAPTPTPLLRADTAKFSGTLTENQATELVSSAKNAEQLDVALSTLVSLASDGSLTDPRFVLYIVDAKHMSAPELWDDECVLLLKDLREFVEGGEEDE